MRQIANHFVCMISRPFGLRLLVAIWSVASARPALAQDAAPSQVFERITVDDGLPENSVRAMIQDSAGFLWMGTHSGLARYDGLEFVDRWHARGDLSSTPRFMVLALAEDGANNIWVGTSMHGVWRFDPRTGDFHDTACGVAGDTDRQVTALASGEGGSMWIGWARSGVCRHAPGVSARVHWRSSTASPA